MRAGPANGGCQGEAPALKRSTEIQGHAAAPHLVCSLAECGMNSQILLTQWPWGRYWHSWGAHKRVPSYTRMQACTVITPPAKVAAI